METQAQQPLSSQQLQKLQAYLKLLDLAKSCQNAGVTATELYLASRQELEQRANIFYKGKRK